MKILPTPLIEKFPALSYLVLIGLVAAIAGGAFGIGNADLLIPAVIGTAVLFLILGSLKIVHFGKRKK